MKVEHGLIPIDHFRARDFIAFCPGMCLTFNDYLFTIATEIKFVGFFTIDSDINCDSRCQDQPLLLEESLRPRFELSADMSIAFRTFSLKWFVHPSSSTPSDKYLCYKPVFVMPT